MSAQRACSQADLPGPGAIRVLLDGEPVAVVRAEDGELHAISDTCTHAEVSLAEGEVSDGTIECWLHGSCFDLRTGEPTSLPAIRPIAVYPVTLHGDDVLVDVANPITDGTTTTSGTAATKER